MNGNIWIVDQVFVVYSDRPIGMGSREPYSGAYIPHPSAGAVQRSALVHIRAYQRTHHSPWIPQDVDEVGFRKVIPKQGKIPHEARSLLTRHVPAVRLGENLVQPSDGSPDVGHLPEICPVRRDTPLGDLGFGQEQVQQPIQTATATTGFEIVDDKERFDGNRDTRMTVQEIAKQRGAGAPATNDEESDAHLYPLNGERDPGHIRR